MCAARLRRVASARHCPHSRLGCRGDAGRLPLADASIDRVRCFNGLHVMPDKEAALAEFRRVLRPGGELIGTALVTDARVPFSAWVRLERLARFFVPPASGELRSLAQQAGFASWSQELEGALLYFRGESSGKNEPSFVR